MSTVDNSATAEHQQHELYRSSLVPMRRLAYLLTGSTQAAEEVVHDAFEGLVRHWAGVDNPGGYLRVAVVNRARSALRKRRAIPLEPAAFDDITPTDAFDATTLAVRDALATLRRAEREVIVLRYYAGMTDIEVADTLRRPIGSVKSQIHRGLDKLKEALS